MDRLDDVLGSAVRMREIGDPNELDSYSGLIRESFSARDRFGVKLRALAGNIGQVASIAVLGRGPQPPNVRLREAFSIVVGRGCPDECSYCGIKSAIGPLVSKPLEEVLAEFRRGIEAGYRDFHLIAGDVGAYGLDLGTDIAVLLGGIFGERGDYRLYIDEFNPRYFVEHFPVLRGLLSSNRRRIGILTLPVQSGSGRIIRMMNRQYSPETLRECLLSLGRACPGIVLGTHVIVGFPGETEEDFEETMSFLRGVPFSYIEAFRYEDRPGIPSAALPAKVPDKVKHRRLRRIRREFRASCRLH
jgi:tRNA A37 methylthiotransferase MiaB